MMSSTSERFFTRYRGGICVTLLAGFVLTPLALADSNDVAADSAAAAIRMAGYPCKHVVEMERSSEKASEGFTVWKVRCNSGSFKVTFKGDAGSEVVPQH